MSVRVYIAARYERREEMVERARELEAIGSVSTASWLDGVHEALDTAPGFGGKAADFAQDDLDDIDGSDWLVLFADTPGTPSRGGRHTEFGYAYGEGIRTAVIGEPENVFHWLPEVWRFGSWGDFLQHIKPEVWAAP